jgi:hypothetical protein
VGVNHRGFYIFVTEEFLNGADIVSILQQMGGEGVTECMWGHMLIDLCTAGGFTDGFLHYRFMNMMAACNASALIFGKVGCGKDILPDPFPVCIQVLVLERIRKVDCSKAIEQILLMDDLYMFKVNPQVLDDRVRQYGETVVLSFSIADDDLMVVEVYIFYPQAHGLHHPQPSSIHNLGYELGCASEIGEQPSDFALREYGGNGAETLWAEMRENSFIQLDVERVTIEEQDSAQSLVSLAPTARTVWVDAATVRSEARWARKARISVAPISAG